tara:strand:+ start:130 stop:612 length:483 start_codon:yes stop_codon:yes gene_type:complete
MANKKKPYNWGIVKPGDIISFKYKSKSTGRMLTHTILVLNPQLNVTLKGGKATKHLIGIKLEQSNKEALVVDKREVSLLERIGNFKQIDVKNNLYKLTIDRRYIVNDILGVKKTVYDILAKSFKIAKQYRTYEYGRATQSAVYLEPIRVFTNIESETDED